MTPLRLFLVDDEHSAVRRLARAREGIHDVAIVGTANDGEEALHKLGTLDVDIVFLDIEMPRLNGIELARRLRERGSMQIIFVTALSEWAVEAFELEAADYVLKPVQNDRIAEALSRARRRIGEARPDRDKSEPDHSGSADDESKAFWIPKGNSKVRVFIDDIVRVEASKDYALIYTSSNTFILRSTMKQLSERFDRTGLVRVHRSAFLNLNLVLKAEYSRRRLARLHTEDGAVVEVSTRYSRQVEELIGAA
jgi:DNA-binding LytR/AlgR family response regulator